MTMMGEDGDDDVKVDVVGITMIDFDDIGY